MVVSVDVKMSVFDDGRHGPHLGRGFVGGGLVVVPQNDLDLRALQPEVNV